MWTAAGGGDYTGKGRPVLIVQDNTFDSNDSITVCPITSDPTEIPLIRIPVAPSEENGLDRPSQIMIDKVTTVRRTRISTRVGRLNDLDLVQVNRAIAVLAGLAATRATRIR